MIRFRRVIACAVLASAALSAGCAVSQTETSDGAPLARQIAQSAHCGLMAPGHVHLKSRADVERLKSLPARNLSLQPLMAVDFASEHIVLAALGQKPTGGFSVTLAGSKIVDGQLELAVRIREPQPGTMVTQALTTPCAVIAVTATGWNGIRITRVENNR